MLREKLSSNRVSLSRIDCSLKLAKQIYEVIDRCREVFFPWLGWVASTNSYKDVLLFLEKSDAEWNENKQYIYRICMDNHFIGLVSVLNVSWQHKRAEIGYWLDMDYTGFGYMQEAVKLIEQELFEKDFNRLVIHTDVLNVKSTKVALSLGYVLEGVLRQNIYSEPHKRFRDQNVFSKLKSD